MGDYAVTALADAVFTPTQTRLKPLIDSGVTIGPVTCRLGVDEGEPIVGVSTGAPVVGLLTKASIPPNCALLVDKRTSRGGKRGRGRLFFPWVLGTTDVGEDGAVTAGTKSTWNPPLASWLSDLDTAGARMVVLHNSGGDTAPGSPNPVTLLLVSTIVGTQRRRLGR